MKKLLITGLSLVSLIASDNGFCAEDYPTGDDRETICLPHTISDASTSNTRRHLGFTPKDPAVLSKALNQMINGFREIVSDPSAPAGGRPSFHKVLNAQPFGSAASFPSASAAVASSDDDKSHESSEKDAKKPRMMDTLEAAAGPDLLCAAPTPAAAASSGGESSPSSSSAAAAAASSGSTTS